MGLFFAWAIGEGILTYRWIQAKAPPPPGALLLVSGLFLSLAILAEYRPARPVAVTFAYAVDLAVLLRVVGKDPTVFPEVKTGKLVTGWPPPAIPATQIWPGGKSAAPAAASQPPSNVSKAASGFNLSGTIQRVIQFLPGIGPVK